ncbi:MAG: hypothetical protein SGJ18_04045 [Pseudomonadota bacterium]|nr:hypothetical protein [Pseudomonadota bacterium]
MGALKIGEDVHGDTVSLSLTGPIDEDANFPNIDLSSFQEVTFDFMNVTAINSCGIREWIRWIENIKPEARVTYSNCPKVIIDQVNMVDGFLPTNAKVGSFYVPYFCESCDNLDTTLYSDPVGIANGSVKVPPQFPCSKCKQAAEIDVIEGKYFKFLKK